VPAVIHVVPKPFPHAKVYGWWPIDLLEEVLAEFQAAEKDLSRWKHFDGPNEEKYEGGPHLFGEATHSLVRSIRATAPRLSQVFDLPSLTMELTGGGYHLIQPGGLLNVHTDFSVSPATRRYRRVNLLIYLNRKWDPNRNGGVLELWDDEGPSRTIVPEFNTTALFVTSSRSWHGHPEPVADRPRRSFAAYFYTPEQPPDFTDQDTVWHPRAPRIR
jgi:Rps23 Pro-64 3,4-dihydroxylase Tpa1-like proline 4-hydroxylase